MKDFPNNWMWADAVDMLSRAERLHRRFFEPGRLESRQTVWEPPADILETDDEVLVFVALPGVDPDSITAVIDDSDLVVVGERAMPPQLRTALIHRLELPQGRFERRLRLPSGRYGSVQRRSLFGCLVVSLEKGGMDRG
jgi:HSP20 family molecular chaperone IbpA